MKDLLRGDRLDGRCKFVDADDIMMSGYKIRLNGLDAPEWNQWAQDKRGRWFNHGSRVKKILSKAIENSNVSVFIDGRDIYGRYLGRLFRKGQDINERMVRGGLAIAAYSPEYSDAMYEAFDKKKGMWSLKVCYDPRGWKACQAEGKASDNPPEHPTPLVRPPLVRTAAPLPPAPLPPAPLPPAPLPPAPLPAAIWFVLGMAFTAVSFLAGMATVIFLL